MSRHFHSLSSLFAADMRRRSLTGTKGWPDRRRRNSATVGVMGIREAIDEKIGKK